MAESTCYTLLVSLPHIDALFSSQTTPISRFQLDRRLSMLETKDQERLVLIENLLHWDHLADDVNESALIRLAEKTREQLESQTLCELLDWSLDMRTIVAALRRKRQGEAAPTTTQWSYGIRYEYIRNHWNSPTLGLGHAFPWISNVVECLLTDNCIELEKNLLQAVWDQLNRLATRHQFDFEAVVIYVLRWNLVAGWSRCDTGKAEVRFRKLVDKGLCAIGSL
ncbi:MAG: DUF2764 family protein [Endozoicomonadaceae bacterium]|nr:DUF2764 family protein [Endozoicomonadaceae bacterium]